MLMNLLPSTINNLYSQKKYLQYITNSNSIAHFIAVIVYYFLTNGSKLSIQLATKNLQFKNFIQKILNETNVSETTILLSLKLAEKVPFSGSNGSEYRIFLTALMLADVYLNDNAYSIHSWAEVSGISNKECIQMRKEFLNGIQFHLAISEHEYLQWTIFLENIMINISKFDPKTITNSIDNSLYQQPQYLFFSNQKPNFNQKLPHNNIYNNNNKFQVFPQQFIY
ncbi:hypothetical protein HDU92_008429 [Lobulomyces angularis]|nr:hypothetical protein HDU92_008429 [Lobulomyces angularis]